MKAASSAWLLTNHATNGSHMVTSNASEPVLHPARDLAVHDGQPEDVVGERTPAQPFRAEPMGVERAGDGRGRGRDVSSSHRPGNRRNPTARVQRRCGPSTRRPRWRYRAGCLRRPRGTTLRGARRTPRRRPRSPTRARRSSVVHRARGSPDPSSREASTTTSAATTAAAAAAAATQPILVRGRLRSRSRSRVSSRVWVSVLSIASSACCRRTSPSRRSSSDVLTTRPPGPGESGQAAARVPLHRTSRHLEGVGDLGLALVEVVAQDEHLPLPHRNDGDRLPEQVRLLVPDGVVLGRGPPLGTGTIRAGSRRPAVRAAAGRGLR